MNGKRSLREIVALCLCFLSGHVAKAQPVLPPLPTVPLDTWYLSQPDWKDIFGDAPLGFANLNTASGWTEAGTCLSVDTNEPAYLDLNANGGGESQFLLDAGTISFWFQANWTSTPDGGSGPGDWASLLTIGQWTSNATASCWSLFIDPDGTNLIFLTQSNGVSQTVLSAPIDFDAGDWHNVCLDYSTTNCALFLEGQEVTNTGAIEYSIADNDFADYGAFVGSESSNGVYQARGQFQYLETYDGPLSTNEIAQNYADFSAIILNAGGSLPSSGFGPDTDPPPDPGGGVSGGGSPDTSYQGPTYTVTTNYANYANFWLTITNNPTNVYVTVNSTLSNLTYAILTNTTIAGTNWGIWQILLASNSYTHAPPLAIGSTNLLFKGALVWSITNNELPDYWCMEYFGTLNVNPYADPDSDGLCNLDEFMLGTNPTNANSITSLHNDAQALFLAYTNFDTNCRYALFVTNGPNTNTLLITLSNTLVGSNYQIYTQLRSDTNNTWVVETNFLGTNTKTTVAITLNGRSLFFVGGYGEDSDGDGLPDGYEVLATFTDPYLPDTGLTGTPDGYKDPDGDGYVNLQEMYNGTNPHVFDTPTGPQGLVSEFTDNGSSLTLSWQAAPGAVTAYIVYAYGPGNEFVPVATNSATQLTYVLDNLTSYYNTTYLFGGFGVKAVYADGSASVNPGVAAPRTAVAAIALVNGPGGKVYMLSSAAATNVIGYTNFYFAQDAWTYPEFDGYAQTLVAYPSGSPETDTNAYIPASQFTNGVAILNGSQIPPYLNTWFNNQFFTNGGLGAAIGGAQLAGGGRSLLENYFYMLGQYPAVPFIDGSSAMKQNVQFLLRAANNAPFGYEIGSLFQISDRYLVNYPTNYVYSSVWYVDPAGFTPPCLDHFAPFEDNYFFRNFAFSTSSATTNGTSATGFVPPYSGDEYVAYGYISQAFQFPTYDYVAFSNSAPIPGILTSDNTQWVGSYSFTGDFATPNIYAFGGYFSGGTTYMSNFANIYGLPYSSLLLTLTDGTQATLSPGGNVSGFASGGFYMKTAEPDLQTVDYYFGKPAIEPEFPWMITQSGDPLPGYEDGSFAITNATPLIMGSVGAPMVVAGYAKQVLLNGNTNIFAYLGQYFSNALVMSNGIATTNSAGILSEYGEFFPTVPGQVALQTMPDPDQSNTNGTCLVDIIRLSLDVNHDGTMDETFTGPDNTGPSAPYTFWINNDYDRWTTSVLDGNVEDDVASNSPAAYTPWGYVPDCEFRDYYGNRLIPCPRDLEDYARLWVSGVSNTPSRLPSGSTVTLSWDYYYNTDQDGNPTYAGNPTIDLFQAADSNGGIGYLTNLTTASNQIKTNLCRYMGRLDPGSNIVLNASTFSNSWAGDHYIWCGVSNGTGQLDLTVMDADNNVLAKSSQIIQIVDIKQMYERWTVGDNDNNEPPAIAGPAAKATLVEDGQPSYRYSQDSTLDTNDDYILFVHGWNMESWEKDRFAETAYKRLYWQGYQGRFGIFRWPTTQFNLLHAYDYDSGEWIAWQSGAPLEAFLSGLTTQYPGKVYVMAHSMGNVVVGEALRLAGTNTIVNTYVASQAAISARAYDNTIPADATNTYVTTGHSVSTPDSEGHYYTNGAPPYFNAIGGASHFVDFYNNVDWALDKWVGDQGDKPEPNYYYTAPTLADPSGYFSTPSEFGDQHNLAFGADTYEIFSQVAKSYSLALGAETNIATVFSIRAPINLNEDPFNFPDTHPGHSEQFRFDNMTTASYWKQLLSSFVIQPQ